MIRTGSVRNIYVASSWRNMIQPGVVASLREIGHRVYDFRHPLPTNTGFDWREVDPNYENWTTEEFRAGLLHPIAQSGFQHDMQAIARADTCVLVLPCGLSSHLEAGSFCNYFGRELFILALDRNIRPELMYKMANKICLSLDELFQELGEVPVAQRGSIVSF